MDKNGSMKSMCSVCPKSFKKISNLNTHMGIHTGIRLHSCAECKKSFARSGALKIHMQIHTRENHVDTSIFPDLSFRQNQTQLNIYFSLCTTCFGTPALITCCMVQEQCLLVQGIIMFC